VASLKDAAERSGSNMSPTISNFRLRQWCRARYLSRAGRRPAFTLVELLVVVALIGLLVALSAPAIQSAREAARQAECKNNLKQLALATLNHHDTIGHFPTGGWGWYWVGDPDRGFGKDQPGGWIFNILPFCEENPGLYDLASDGQPDELSRVQRVGAAQVVQSPLAIVNCPSRRLSMTYPLTANQGGIVGFFNSITPDTAGRSDYAANAGDVYCEWPQATLGRGPTSYGDAQLWSANRSWGSDQPRLLFATLARVDTMTGISFERSSVRISNVVDGLSKTYLAAERYVPIADYETGLTLGDNETWCTGFNNDNYRKTGRLANGEIDECAPIPDWKTDAEESDDRFGSAHPNGWNAAFCDGSVRTMTYEIDWRVHRDLGNRMDGGVVGPADRLR
jgi:prepilin-type N-terminal cleavage/methylation domain-containing protein/prepilin-type processing-associated H-X9-DG protein